MKYRLIACVALLALSSSVLAQTKKTKAKTPPKPSVKAQDVTKAQGQQQGGDGVFGTIYTMNSGWNFTILKARYSIEPYKAYEWAAPNAEEKFLVLTLAIKNSLPGELFFGGPEFTAVDEEGHDYVGANYRLASTESAGVSLNLKPGQGSGQNPDKDELTCMIKVPAKARISKIILKDGRKFVKGEEVVRYFIADVATKERDGAPGNPKNTIAGLPDSVKDKSDKLGAVAMPQGVAKIGTPFFSSYFEVTCNSVALSSAEKYKDALPEEGKQYAIANFTVKNLYKKQITLFEFGGGESVLLKDVDGEKYALISDSLWKAKRDEATDNPAIEPGENYTFRCFFSVPKDVKLKTLRINATSGRVYAIDIETK